MTIPSKLKGTSMSFVIRRPLSPIVTVRSSFHFRSRKLSSTSSETKRTKFGTRHKTTSSSPVIQICGCNGYKSSNRSMILSDSWIQFIKENNSEIITLRTGNEKRNYMSNIEVNDNQPNDTFVIYIRNPKRKNCMGKHFSKK